MHNIETSRPLVTGRPGPCLFAYAARAVAQSVVGVQVQYTTAHPRGCCFGPSGSVWRLRESCGLDQSSMRSGCDSTAPRDLVAK